MPSKKRRRTSLLSFDNNWPFWRSSLIVLWLAFEKEALGFNAAALFLTITCNSYSSCVGTHRKIIKRRAKRALLPWAQIRIVVRPKNSFNHHRSNTTIPFWSFSKLKLFFSRFCCETTSVEHWRNRFVIIL